MREGRGLGQRTSWALDCDDAGANVDFDLFWNDQLLG